MKYGEGYKLMQRAMTGSREGADPLEIRPLCLAADWVHLKLLLYAIGSGTVTADNMRTLHAQWAAHMRTFGQPLGAQRFIAFRTCMLHRSVIAHDSA